MIINCIINTARSSHLKIRHIYQDIFQILVNCLGLGLGSTVIQSNITSEKLSNTTSDVTIF